MLVGPGTDPRAATWPGLGARWLRTARYERVGDVPVLVPQYSRTGGASMLRGMDAVRRYRTDHALAGTDVPLEVVRGEHDRIAPLDWCTTLAAGPGDRVTSVPGAAHMVPITHPGAVTEAVQRVLARAAASDGSPCHGDQVLSPGGRRASARRTGR